MLFSSGDLFNGNWISNEMSGHGVYINKLGDNYIGNFMHD
jgi:hypothetical protein